MKKSRNMAVYGPMKHKTYGTALYDLIRTEFGYIGGPDVISLFVRKIVELNTKYYLPESYVKPGQMRWLAIKLGEKYARGKTMRDMKLVPVTLTLISEEDIEDASNTVDIKERRLKLIQRIHLQARDQGGALSESDSAMIMRVGDNTISKLILAHEKDSGSIIPRCGTEMDIGRTLTHKKLAFNNYKKKMTTTENARSIDHSPISVDKYIRDGIRVEKLHGAEYNEYDISFLTGLSIGLVNEYIKVITEINLKGSSENEKHNKNNLNQGVGVK